MMTDVRACIWFLRPSLSTYFLEKRPYLLNFVNVFYYFSYIFT